MTATVTPLHERREPPANVEAEQLLIGAVLVANGAYDVVAPIIRPEHFRNELHRDLWSVIARDIEAGREVSPVTLQASIHDQEGVTHGYLERLAAGAFAVVNVADYARTVYNAWVARELILDCTETMDRLHQRYDSEEIEAAAAELQNTLDMARGGATERRPAAALSDAARNALDRSAAIQRAREQGQSIPIVSTGLTDLDRHIGGLFEGQLIVLAGSTGMGKSSLALGIAEHEAGHGGAVAFFSLEMSSDELAQRSITARSGVPMYLIRNGYLKPDQYDRAQEAAAAFESLPLLVDDNASTTVADIRRNTKALARTRNLRLIVVDYLQLVLSDGRNDNRALEVARVTRSLKQLAKELAVPVLALSQLSRTIDGRDDKRPVLSDLRESGSIEQDADVVLFCYRPGYYQERKKPQRMNFVNKPSFDEAVAAWEADIRILDDEAEIIVAKQRQGQANISAKVRFEKSTVRYMDKPDEQQGGMEF